MSYGDLVTTYINLSFTIQFLLQIVNLILFSLLLSLFIEYYFLRARAYFS